MKKSIPETINCVWSELEVGRENLDAVQFSSDERGDVMWMLPQWTVPYSVTQSTLHACDNSSSRSKLTSGEREREREREKFICQLKQ